MRRIVRRLPNDAIDLLQFCAHGKIYKECFGELIGLINSKRRQPDEFAFARRGSERVLSRINAICSDMNRHVRLENRRIASTCEIVDDSLKEAMCRLGRDEPVSNDSLPGHETPTSSGSTPLLQLDNVTFGISSVNQTNQSCAVYFGRGDFSHSTTAGCDHCF